MIKRPIRHILRYYWDSNTIFSAHSPFVYQFFRAVLSVSNNKASFQQIEKERSKLLASTEEISFVDYGAGSKSGRNDSHRKIRDVARYSLSGQWQCEVLHNLIKFVNGNQILELGTSFGISTAYMHLGNPNAQLITLEGNPASLETARLVWKNLGIRSIQGVLGVFENTLPKALQGVTKLDVVFIDGNHRKKATLKYFDSVQPLLHEKSVCIIDDIYWSEEMHAAWEEIKSNNEVAFTIDLFCMGLVFFDHSRMPKRHFKLIPYKWKPWSIGLFA